jgi:hypothetical protein
MKILRLPWKIGLFELKGLALRETSATKSKVANEIPARACWHWAGSLCGLRSIGGGTFSHGGLKNFIFYSDRHVAQDISKKINNILGVKVGGPGNYLRNHGRTFRPIPHAKSPTGNMRN